ncbi:hypothetical protein [Borrelia miyamotoi]
MCMKHLVLYGWQIFEGFEAFANQSHNWGIKEQKQSISKIRY